MTGLEFQPPSLILKVGDVKHMDVAVFPEDATNLGVVFSNYNPEVAYLDADCRLFALAPGFATIAADAVDGSGVTATLQVQVIQESLSLLPGSTYFVTDGFLMNVQRNTTVAALLGQFGNEAAFLRVVDADGKARYGTALVGTGCVILYEYEPGLIDSLAVVIRGDTTGDGKVNLNDCARASAIIASGAAAPPFLLAADANGSGVVNVTDMVFIVNIAGGI